MVYEFADYRTFLKTTLAERSQRSPGYSLRSFSQKIGISNSYLSEVLSAKKSMSVELAFKIAMKLDLTDAETQFLCVQVQLEHETDPELREKLEKRLKQLNPSFVTHDVSADIFKVIADWYHFAILELTMLASFTADAGYIAAKLGISKSDAQAGFERLLRLGLLERTPEGRYRKTHEHVLTQSKVPDQACRHFHRQVLEQALESLESQTPKSRMSATEIMAIDSHYLARVDRLSQEFSAAVWELAEKSKTKDAVYALCTHYFRLSDREQK